MPNRIYTTDKTGVAKITVKRLTGVAKVVVASGIDSRIVPVSNITSPTKLVSGEKTKVKSLIVGRPVRRIQEATTPTMDTISGVDMTDKVDGSILVYRSSSTLWEPTLAFDHPDQCVNGGQY